MCSEQILQGDLAKLEAALQQKNATLAAKLDPSSAFVLLSLVQLGVSCRVLDFCRLQERGLRHGRASSQDKSSGVPEPQVDGQNGHLHD